jgi:hypothetical protein
MRRRPLLWWLAWGLLVLYGILVAGVIVLDETVARPDEVEESFAETLSLLVAFSAFAVVGALVASRQPRNTVGWLFLACPLFAITAAFSEEYAYRAYVLDPGSLPLGAVFGWLYTWTWYPGLAAIGLAALLFPDGRPPGPRWRLLVWAYVGTVVLATAGASVYPARLDTTDPRWPEKPLGIDGLKPVLDVASTIGGVFFLPLLLGVLASVVVRFRRSRGDERQQLKWMLAAILLIALLIAADSLRVSRRGFCSAWRLRSYR